MFHRNGTLLARYPQTPSSIGKVFNSGPLLQHLRFSDAPATIRTVSPIDNIDRLGSIRLLQTFRSRWSQPRRSRAHWPTGATRPNFS